MNSDRHDTYENLGEREKNLAGIYALSPIFVGTGFRNYLWTDGADFYEESIVSLNAIGATRAAAALETIRSLMPDGEIIADCERRKDFLEESSKDFEDRMRVLGKRFNAESENVFRLTVQYYSAERE